jgi:hypothetical protein
VLNLRLKKNKFSEFACFKEAVINVLVESPTMLRKSILYILLFPLGSSLIAQDLSFPVRDTWSFNTAYLMPAHKWECGIYQPFRYGLSNKLEIHANAIILPLIPNAGIKVALGSHDGFVFASDHFISSQTIFLNVVSREGIGGLISPEFDFPFIIAISNSFIVSKPIGTESLLSGSAGFVFAFRGDKPDPQSTIDLPVIYPRMTHSYEGITFRAGISYKGAFTRKLFYEEGLQSFFVTRSKNNFFAENSGSLMWAAGRAIRIKAGYILSYGKYPFDGHWQLWPTIDIVFGSRI